MQHDMYWLWLHEAPGITRVTKWKMLEYFSTPEEIFYATTDMLKSFITKSTSLDMFMESRDEDSIYQAYNLMEENQITFFHTKNEMFPQSLRLIPDPPLALYVKGYLPKKDEISIAIIGARDCTRYGSEMARFFGRELGKAGIQVISGLARGIDGMAHRGALDAQAYTLGVLGCGINVVYPEENYDLFMKMEKCGGVVSESGLNVKPHMGLFPQRNRLISGFADGILVVEAMEKSGTFITVDQGLEQGKEIFALPGRNIDVKSRGCNNLIKMGAHIVTEVSDILEIVRSKNTQAMRVSDLINGDRFVCKNLLAPNEKIVYSCLRVEPQYLDEIICKSQIAPQEVCMALNRLAVIGGAVETSRNYYALKL